MDLLLTVPCTVLLLPVFLLIALAILLDSGWPIVHGSWRHGEGGRLFKMYKFRTMIVNAERRRQQASINFPDRRREHKTNVDPRITRMGRFLRRTSLDELPQLVNVLLGTMSLVGPRPEVPAVVATFDSWQWERFAAPSGITGLWQIRGRSTRPCWLMCLDDIEYISGYSLRQDLRILYHTLGPVISGRGAY